MPDTYFINVICEIITFFAWKIALNYLFSYLNLSLARDGMAINKTKDYK